MNAEARRIAQDVQNQFARLQDADYYDVLGVSKMADDKTIRDRFRELARKYHADRYTQIGLPRPVVSQMTELLGIISRAHATLTNAEKRREYDATLELAAAGVPSDLGTIMEAEGEFRAGRTLLERGQYEAALVKLDHAADLNPAEPEYAATAAFCKYWTLDRDSKGRAKNRTLSSLIVEHIANFLKENPRNDYACVYLAQMAKAEGDPDRARDYFEEALAINPKNLVAARELRLSHMRKKKGANFFKNLFGGGKKSDSTKKKKKKRK